MTGLLLLQAIRESSETCPWCDHTKLEKEDALFGTINSWLIWNLTGGVNNGLHVTDVSNSSRTMFMDLKTLDWDKSTLEMLKIPAEILPKVESQLLCLGDQQAAMLGQACRSGEAKSTSGTGAFILLSTSEELIQSTHGLLSTKAFKLGPDAPTKWADLLGNLVVRPADIETTALGAAYAAGLVGMFKLVGDATGMLRLFGDFNAMVET
ncbi:hypothetical protein HYC85_027724 [Camellia sinensis]|uniref:Carbohydrate kinase FGGY N-terminal domain-containing protein n=1 Tax=Camellia sinensis TaxID=4442 RepID=A0A7J7FT31_CAMSI|nr:hypothetical protein HYC85_027724 [Camellia sinensis]